MDRPVSATGVRQTLHRAREKFANLLIDEIGQSLETAQREAIEQELIDLDLLIFCKSALGKRYAQCQLVISSLSCAARFHLDCLV